MKKFEIKQSKVLGKGEDTQKVLEFLVHDGDAVLYTDGKLNLRNVAEIAHKFNLIDFLKVRGYDKKIVIS